jgi:hypothetical protein
MMTKNGNRMLGYRQYDSPLGYYFVRTDDVPFMGTLTTFIQEYGLSWGFTIWNQDDQCIYGIRRWAFMTPEDAAQLANEKLNELLATQRAKLKQQRKTWYEHEV